MAPTRKLTQSETKKLLESLREKNSKALSSTQFRHDALEAQKRINYQNEFNRLRGDKSIADINHTHKKRMELLQKMAKSSLLGEVYHNDNNI